MEKEPLRKKRLEEFGERMLKYSEIIKKNACVLSELYSNGMEEFKRPYKFPNFEEIESSNTSSINNDSGSTQEEKSPFLHIGSINSTTDDEKVLSLQQKIEAKHKRSKRYWNILSIDDEKCVFDTLSEIIRLTVHIDKETEIVHKTHISYHKRENCEAVALFVHKIFKDRLSLNNMQAAVGERYDVLTLLD
ncbi:hypothetical protein ILUMI_27483 [Ignelater luminosus]|uniref:Uncharacterized protein n=1 Tax=Ignelater luminosus TaxID=2038154 RepID=A0A8K0C359_IGNLU|nr:hypothetical protein ILUMI_27483 [Ignelater luminosus]